MKVIHVLLIIILILSIILGIKIVNSKNKNIMKETENIQKTNNGVLELEKIKEIINKSESINNFYLKTNITEIEIKNKDGKVVYISNKGKTYVDYKDDFKKAVIITENNKTATKTKKEKVPKIDMIKTNNEKLYTLINNCEKYEINKNETFNNFDCISLTIFYKYYSGAGWNFEENLEEYNEKTIETNILIDQNTGVIMKIASKIDNKENTAEYYYKFNCVTEEEVTIPDLSGYKIVEVN